MQFSGPFADTVPVTVCVDRSDYLQRMESVQHCLRVINATCRFGVSDDVLDASLSTLSSLQGVLSIMRRREHTDPDHEALFTA